ncbi:MAG: hypothetical protein ACW99Q_05815 [Candidatus Kariarchaeaceae archaeon]
MWAIPLPKHITPALLTNTSDLTADWTFFDEDGDTQPGNSWIIRWYNNITGLQSAYNDLKTVPAAATVKDQEWWFTLYVYDGFEYSIEYTSPVKKIINTAPTASNVAIEGTPSTTDLLNATWDYSDADFDSQVSYRIRWYMNNGSGFIYQNQFDDNLRLNPSFTEKGQTWNFTLEVFDGSNYSVMYISPTKTIVNSAPTASTLTITTDPVTTTDLVANWTYTDADSDVQSSAWRVRWYRDGSLVSSFNDLLTVPAGYTNKSEVWNYTVQVFDGTEYSILYYSGSTTIQNTAPVVTSVSLTPFSPNATSNQDLQVSWTYFDLDGDLENVSAVQIRWYRNGVLAPLLNDSVIISYQNTTRGDDWYFQLWAFDGESYSSFNTSNAVTIINSLPIFVGQPTFNNTSPGENEDFNVTLSNYYDEDSDSIQNMTVFWFVNGVENQTLFNQTVISQSDTEIGQFWYYIINVYDGLEWSGNITSRTIGIGQPANNAPQADNLNLTIGSFFPLTTDGLTATYDYSDPIDSHPEFGTFIYWYMDNGTGWVLQSQFNGSFTISSSFTSEGQLWYFVIVPKDVFPEPTGGWNSTNSPNITISNSAPVITTYSLTANPNNITNLVASYTSFDADSADTLSIEILWYQNGILRPDLNNSEIIYANMTFKGDQWNYSIQVSDEVASSIWYNSSITTILNTGPEITSSILVLPATPLTSENLSVSYTYFDLDGDSQATAEIFWYRNGKLEPLLNNSLIVSSSFTKKNENWYYTVKVNDSETFSILYISTTIQIANSQPSVSNLSFSPSDPKRGDALTLIYTWTDPDQNANDIESGTRIRWYRNSNLVPSLNDTLTVPGELIIKGDNWNVTIEPSDGTVFGIIMFINVTISNTAPVITSGIIIPGSTAFTTSDLIASYTMTDVDSDPLTVASILWYNNSQLVPSLNGKFIVPSNTTTKHDVWYYELQVFDGLNLSTAFTSSNITILNSLPTITSFELVPGSPRTTNNLSATWTYEDADNDPQQAPLIRWYKINILQPALNDSVTVDSSLTTKNELWFFRIQVYDGENYSVIVESSTIQILNSLPVVSTWQFTSGLTPTTLEDLFISYNFTDADPSDTFLSARIRWYRDGELQALFNDQPTVPASATTHFEYWNVTIQPFDGQSFGVIVSLNVTIINSKPNISSISLSPEQNAFTTSQLIISYSPTDFDSDIIQAFNITWFVGPNPGALVAQPSYANLTTIFANQTVKGQWWGVEVMVFDGTDWSDPSTRQLKEIKNSQPIASNIVLTPSGLIFSNETITLSWTYSDPDNDTELTPYIIWYRNALNVSALENNSIVPISFTSKNENWYAVLHVFDGSNLSQSYNLPVFTIENSIPIINSAVINAGVLTTDVSVDLVLSYISFDADALDFDQNRTIYWYKNGFYQSGFNGNFTIPKENLIKGETWYYIVSVSDGQVWSANYTSLSILIVNSLPEVSNIQFVGTENPNFIVEDENITLSYNFFDADSLDPDQSFIKWYVDYGDGVIIYLDQYTNNTVIPSSVIQPGQIWYVEIIPFDGEENGISVISVNKTIEDRPDILEYGVYPTNLTEGNYIFWFNITATPITPVSSTARPTIGLDIVINNSDSVFDVATWNPITHYYELNWHYTNYELLGSIVDVTVLVSTNVRYNNIPSLISAGLIFDFPLLDTTPPRVKNVIVGFIDEELIDNITFSVEIEEFGSTIENVTLFYYFDPTTSEPDNVSIQSLRNFKLTKTAQLPPGYKTVLLTMTDSSSFGISTWEAIVDIDVNSSVLILFQIQVSDNNGNIDLNAWPEGLDASKADKYTYPISGIPIEEVITYVAAIMVIMVIFSFIVIKKFRSKELVGLDIDVVLANIQKMKLKDKEVENVLDSHTLGVVISFFDQRHGPIPVMQEPAILRDNFEKLVELSDLSFSAVRFVDNFEDEIQASFDFTVDERTRVSSISYAYSLNRPNARGGAENLTLNILVLKDVYPLVSQFTNQFAEIVNKVHKIMDIDPNAKEKVQKEIIELRYLVSRIVLSYVDIYDTTELIIEETED